MPQADDREFYPLHEEDDVPEIPVASLTALWTATERVPSWVSQRSLRYGERWHRALDRRLASERRLALWRRERLPAGGVS